MGKNIAYWLITTLSWMAFGGGLFFAFYLIIKAIRG